MLLVTAHAVISTLYISSYQHVYSQAASSALILGQTSSSLGVDLEDMGYLVTTSLAVPPGLGEYDVVILEGSVDLSGSLEIFEEYVENGGGLVFLGGAAESLQLSTNNGWLGAQTMGLSGFGENATVTIDNPLDSSLAVGDILRSQSAEQLGAILVDDLESNAAILASYTNGGVFAYSYESGGKVYFQAYADAGIGDIVTHANVKELLISGVVWATAQPNPVTDLLPLGTGITTDNSEPSGSSIVSFAESGHRSLELSVPEDPILSIFVTADSGLTNPILFFTVDGQEYRYNVQIDKGTLLSFPSALNVTSARFAVDNWVSGVGVVGYVTLRSPPSCNLPTGAEITTPSSIPPDALSLGSPGPTGFVNINNPPIPITSLLLGFETEVNGYLLKFDSLGAPFQCPIQPELIEISFGKPTAITNALVMNDGPWGEVGYEEINSNVTAFAKFTIPKGTVLPVGFTIEPSSAAPSHIESATFSQDALDVRDIIVPGKKVSAMWVGADDGLVDPHLYLKAGDGWYAIEIDQVNGALIDFTPSIQFDEIYASADGGQAGSVSVGYVYPIPLNARAGADQTVVEEQIVYLDARASSGSQMSFKWTQTEGPTVPLRDANTDRAHFSAPEVSESGERISFRLVVTDPDGIQSSDIVAINVKDVKIPNNSPPAIGSVAGATVDEGAQVVLAASAFDSDGDTLKYSWTQKDGPTARLSGANTPTLSIFAPVVTLDSILTFEIRVADGRGHAVTNDVVVTVLNARDEIVPVDASISAGEDQFVVEGSVVQLGGEYQSGTSLGQEFRWEQTAGISVTLNVQSALNASFVAPQTDGSTLLTFRLGLIDSQGTITKWDDVSIMVSNTAQVPVVDNSVEIEQEGAQTPSSFEIEPTFSAVKRVDAEPPKEIHRLSIPGSDGAGSPTPTAPVVGIWLDSNSEMSGLELHFSASGRKYSINAMAGQATAYVFDRQVDVRDVRLTASSNVESIGIGYYYDQVPLASVSPTTTRVSQQDEPGAIQAIPPQEGLIIKFARENQLATGLMAIVVPVGIGVGLKMATNHRRKKLANPARTLFPKNDPVAGEAAKVRPVIEELEKMLGRDLDTAVSASELLDKFGSGRSEASQR